MKNYIKLFLAVCTISVVSCEDVIDVDVQTDTLRLVVEASLDWEKGTTGNDQSITLRTSTPFFDTQSTDVIGAEVNVTNNSTGEVYPFTDQNNGTYTTTTFDPQIYVTYTLEIIYDGERFTAEDTLRPVPNIKEVYQDTEDGFDDETIELHIVFDDFQDEGDSYFFKFERPQDLLPTLEVGDDEFINGNEVDWWYEIDDDEDEEIKPLLPGDIVTINMHSISRPYYNYMDIVIDQLGGVGIFESTPVEVKGNCINTTDPENYAHGYFRVTQKNSVIYTVE
ncbi:uncharacterized protein DUF4249 [Maribacter spongiicola]|uniref:Uncharacterized protein DUF4249 n=1 Tax=Maribacter spongiicola TaxID=1206753 RepID=A0A4R7K652_9FLAO|nr:DUF4249 family protein [Maribacter spongiicola]TDT45159.1 uncharacterized protein DUF4249 [Maribacter spongiicola]